MFPLVRSPRTWERQDHAHEAHTYGLIPRAGPVLSRFF